MLVTPGTVLMTASSLSWKTSKVTDRLKGLHNHLYFPQGVLNIISKELLLSSKTIQQPDLASISVKYLDLWRFCTKIINGSGVVLFPLYILVWVLWIQA